MKSSDLLSLVIAIGVIGLVAIGRLQPEALLALLTLVIPNAASKAVATKLEGTVDGE